MNLPRLNTTLYYAKHCLYFARKLHMDESALESNSNKFHVLCRHIVSLSWVEATTDPNIAERYGGCNRVVRIASTFVISVRDIWFLVTAGHILKEMHARL